MSTVLLGFLVVFLAGLAAAAGLWLVRRLTSFNRHKEHNDVAGFIYSILQRLAKRLTQLARSTKLCT